MKRLGLGVVFLLFAFTKAYANTGFDSSNIEGSDYGLQQIRIPIFDTLFTDISSYNTVLSWVTYAGAVLVSLVVIYWIYKIIRAGVFAIQAEGDDTKITEARQRLQAALSGIAFTLLVPIVLSFVGVIFGFGTMFQWPKSFSGCQDTSEYDYYFQAFAQEASAKDATEACNPDGADLDR
jgi:hypothetical protein